MVSDIAFSIFYIIAIGVSTSVFMYIIRYTDGPFDVLRKLREFIGYVYLDVYDTFEDIVDIIEEPPDNFVGKLLECPWCFSFWICVVSYIPFYYHYIWYIVPHMTLVSVAIAVYMYNRHSKLVWQNTQMDS